MQHTKFGANTFAKLADLDVAPSWQPRRDTRPRSLSGTRHDTPRNERRGKQLGENQAYDYIYETLQV